MELSTADIQLLYGPTLWLTTPHTAAPAAVQPPAIAAAPTAQPIQVPPPPAQVAQAPPAQAPPTPSGPLWAHQAGAVLAAVVPAQHLADPTMRDLLHKMCAAVQVPPERLNLLAAPFVQDHHLLDARTRFVLIFGQEIYPSANETSSMQGIEIYRLPYLAQLLHDTAAKRHAWELMKQFKDRIYE